MRSQVGLTRLSEALTLPEVACEWRMNGGWRQGIRKWRYHGMPRRYAAHLRVKGLPAGSSSDLQGCKPRDRC